MMNQKKWLGLAAVLGSTIVIAAHADADTVVVSSFAAAPVDPLDPPINVWYNSDVRPGAIATIESAPPGSPLPIDAAKLTTTLKSSKAEVGINNNYGSVQSIFNTLAISYEYYKVAVGDTQPAPSLKLTFVDSLTNPTKSQILVYEARFNGPVNPVTGQWVSNQIDLTHGIFWANYSQFGFTIPPGSNFGGTGNLFHLDEWETKMPDGFQSAILAQVSIGVGSGNLDQQGYFDKVVINGTAVANTTYNFEAAAVPEPSSLISCTTGLLMGLGLVWRRRKSAKAAC